MVCSLLSYSRKRSSAPKCESNNVDLKSLRSYTSKNQDGHGRGSPRLLMPTWIIAVLLAANQSLPVLCQYSPYNPIAPSYSQPFGSYGGSPSPLSSVAQSSPFSNPGYGFAGMTNMPSSSPFNSPSQLANILGGIPTTSLPNSPLTVQFGGVSSMAIPNSPSIDPFMAQLLSGTSANPSQNLQVNQGWGAAQPATPFSNAFGNVQAGYSYPQMTTFPQLGLNAEANPFANIGATINPYQSSTNQLSNILQATGLGLNPSYDFLKGFKEGFDASVRRIKSSQLFGDSSQNLGIPAPFPNYMVGASYICDYSRQNCPQTYSSQYGQYPCIPQSWADLCGGSKPVFQTGAYNYPPNTQPFVGLNQSQMSFQQQPQITWTGFAPSNSYGQPSVMNMPDPQTGHPHAYSPSNPPQPTAGYHGVTMPTHNAHA